MERTIAVWAPCCLPRFQHFRETGEGKEALLRELHVAIISLSQLGLDRVVAELETVMFEIENEGEI